MTSKLFVLVHSYTLSRTVVFGYYFVLKHSFWDIYVDWHSTKPRPLFFCTAWPMLSLKIVFVLCPGVTYPRSYTIILQLSRVIKKKTKTCVGFYDHQYTLITHIYWRSKTNIIILYKISRYVYLQICQKLLVLLFVLPYLHFDLLSFPGLVGVMEFPPV